MVSIFVFHSGDRGSIPPMDQHIFNFPFSQSHPSRFTKPSSLKLKPNTCNNKARHIKFHQYVCQFLPRDNGGFEDKNQKMSDFLGIAQKVRHFLILVPKTAMISWQKLANIASEMGQIIKKINSHYYSHAS